MHLGPLLPLSFFPLSSLLVNSWVIFKFHLTPKELLWKTSETDNEESYVAPWLWETYDQFRCGFSLKAIPLRVVLAL